MSPYDSRMLSTLFIESMVVSTISANQVGRMTLPFIRDRVACNPTPSLVVKKTWPNQTSRMKRPEFQSTQSRNLSMKSPREEDPPKTNRFKLGEAYLNDTSERPNLDLKTFNTELKNYMTVYAHNSEPSVKRFNAEHYRIPEPLQSPSSEPSNSSEDFQGDVKSYMDTYVKDSETHSVKRFGADHYKNPVVAHNPPPSTNTVEEKNPGWCPSWCTLVEVVWECYKEIGPNLSEKMYVDHVFFKLYKSGFPAIRERIVYTTDGSVTTSRGRVDLEIAGKFLLEFKIVAPSSQNILKATRQTQRYMRAYRKNKNEMTRAAIVFIHGGEVRIIEVFLPEETPRFRPY
jgi:hypothetical protein